ncbi:MAG TPA: XTP/dITP diphosphatase [Paenibacillus sp.]|jgi:XTP/dITP diphosphohydrolase
MKFDQDTIIVATKNKGKVREFEHAFAPLGLKVKSMFDYIELPDVIEDGHTFVQNALKKATTVGDALGLPVLADDSGLCVDALEGRPGVYSARYAGENATDQENNDKLLQELGELKQGEDTEQVLLSPARFECSLVLYDPSTKEHIEASGSVEGWITSEVAGQGGFGYDPLFFLPQYEQNMAELTLEQKQSSSHRGAALRKLVAKISES